jgi:hypothetical protein
MSKIMNIKNIGFFSFLFLLLFSACRKNVDDVTTTETPYTPPIIDSWVQPLKIVTGSLTGFVMDEAGEPVMSAAVRLGGLETKTDEYGHFFFKDVDLNAKGTLVRIEKDGYFPGSRRFFAIEDAENRVQVQLITKTLTHSFSAETGANVQFAEANVVFSPNSIQDSEGNIYSGTVNVYAKWLDPEKIETLDQMPGNLQGVNTLAEQVVLGTAGMMVVELESETGEKLNILEGKTAEISMSIPSTLTNPPAEIPNWSYNEEHGMWVEEGVSVLQGDKYVGQVSHFSYWNHDFKDPLIEFTAKFTDENGVPLENYRVVIRQESTGLYGTGHTCDRGIVTGLIPQDYDLILEVFGVCGELLYSQDIGPYSNDTDLGTIAIPSSQLFSIIISGELVDCTNNPVQNGLVIFKYDGQTVYEYTNGQPFNVLMSTCVGTDDIEVIGIDLDALLQSDGETVSVSNGDTDLGQISVCDQQLQNFIELTVDGVTALYVPAYIISGANSTTISYSDSLTQDAFIYMGFNGDTPGNYDGDSGNWLEFIQDNWNNWVLSPSTNSFDTFEVTEFGNVGEPIIGAFSGTAINFAVQPSVQVNITGNFNIIRQ